MKLLFVINEFLKTKSFSSVYSEFEGEAKKHGVLLTVKTNAELSVSLPEKADFDAVIFWDKDILLAERLENKGFRLFNRASAIEICDSKQKTAVCFEKHKIPVPKTVISPKTFENIGYTDLDFLENAAEKTGFPMIIKEEFGSFGKQVYLANDLENARETVKKISPKGFVMQEYISDCRGVDLRLCVVGGKVVSAIKRSNPEDFRSNIENGGFAEKVIPTENQQTLAIRAADAAGLDFAGVDILPSKNGDLVCEINSNPHFAGTLSATGINIAEEIIGYIKKVL